MKSYKNITNYNYTENCKCIEYKDQLDIQSSKITCLEYEIDDLKKDNQELKIENQEFKKRITVLEKENKELNIIIIKLENKNNNLEFNKLRIKIITAIQDLNNYEKLEVKFTYPLNTCIANIRFNRNMSNHYIDINYSLNLIENKKKYLLLQLLNLSVENIQNLNDRYQIDTCTKCNVIEEVINYLKNNSSHSPGDLTNQDLKNIEWWWTD